MESLLYFLANSGSDARDPLPLLAARRHHAIDAPEVRSDCLTAPPADRRQARRHFSQAPRRLVLPYELQRRRLVQHMEALVLLVVLPPERRDHMRDHAGCLVARARPPHANPGLLQPRDELVHVGPEHRARTTPERFPPASTRNLQQPAPALGPIEALDDEIHTVVPHNESWHLMTREPSVLHRRDEIADRLQLDPHRHGAIRSLPPEPEVPEVERLLLHRDSQLRQQSAEIV